VSTNNPTLHESIGEIRDLVVEALKGIQDHHELWPQCQTLVKAADTLSQVQIQLGIPPRLAEHVQRELAATKRSAEIQTAERLHAKYAPLVAR
jgi:hypothetical protein